MMDNQKKIRERLKILEEKYKILENSYKILVQSFMNFCKELAPIHEASKERDELIIKFLNNIEERVKDLEEKNFGTGEKKVEGNNSKS